MIGTVFNCFMNIPYQMQLAHKWTSLTFYLNLCAAIILIPLLLLFTHLYGTIGAASIWVIINGAYLVVEIPIMHRMLLKNEMWTWYIHDICKPVVVVVIIATILKNTIVGHLFCLSIPLLFFIYVVLTLTALLVLPKMKTHIKYSLLLLLNKIKVISWST